EAAEHLRLDQLAPLVPMLDATPLARVERSLPVGRVRERAGAGLVLHAGLAHLDEALESARSRGVTNGMSEGAVHALREPGFLRSSLSSSFECGFQSSDPRRRGSASHAGLGRA